MTTELGTTLQQSLTIALMMFLLGLVYGKSKQFGVKAGKKSKRYFMSFVSAIMAMIFFSIYVSTDAFDDSIIPGLIASVFLIYAIKSPYKDVKKNSQKWMAKFS